MPDYRLGRLKGEFVVVWEEGGKRRRFRLGTREPKEARAYLREFVKERERLQRPESSLTVGDIWADYVAEKEAEGKVSVGRMEDAWKQLGPTFGHLRPDQCDSPVVRGYVVERGKKAGPGTVHVELGYLRAALRHSLGGKAPAIKLPSKPRPKSRHLTPVEARKLLDACKMPHVRIFVELSLRTAGRPSSILGLRWSQIDFGRGTINLDDPTRDRTAKGRATVPLAECLVGPLREAQRAALTEFVIEWAGKPVKSIKKAIGRAGARAGMVGLTPYVLRHTAAVWMAEGGTPMEEIAQYMGHTSPNVTFRTYARYSPNYLQKAAKAISDRLTQGTEVLQTEAHKPSENEKGLDGEQE